MTSSLVGSEMCIRDSDNSPPTYTTGLCLNDAVSVLPTVSADKTRLRIWFCLLYTSDAADDM
eukprot:11378531-Prorocentrum_lima.AAC.1